MLLMPTCWTVGLKNILSSHTEKNGILKRVCLKTILVLLEKTVEEPTNASCITQFSFNSPPLWLYGSEAFMLFPVYFFFCIYLPEKTL